MKPIPLANARGSEALSRICIALAMASATFAAAAQTLSFEVASVKPTAPSPDGRVRFMVRGGPGTSDPGQITYQGRSLKDLISSAYGVKSFQVSGPGWLDTERFDIVAKIPEGTTKEQFNVMMQNLLAERFKLVVHREKKDFPLYELTIAKGGPKLKPSTEDPSAAAGPPPPGPPPIGKDGFPQVPAGRPAMMMNFLPGGQRRLMAMVQPVSTLADMLSNLMDGPVIDKTGLTGKFDFTLEFTPEQGFGAGPLGAAPPPQPPNADPGQPAGLAAADQLSGLFTALQEQLGLKLERKKGPLDVWVVDRAEKVPAEN
jgi:uncharacterized protein (TIGR03435 family)